jgi:hypothetical protein
MDIMSIIRSSKDEIYRKRGVRKKVYPFLGLNTLNLDIAI